MKVQNQATLKSHWLQMCPRGRNLKVMFKPVCHKPGALWYLLLQCYAETLDSEAVSAPELAPQQATSTCEGLYLHLPSLMVETIVVTVSNVM